MIRALVAWRTSSLVSFVFIMTVTTSNILYLGYPGCEFHIRDALAKVLGKEKSEFFFDKVC